MRVLVTRPAPQAGKWVKALQAAGLDAVSLPLIEITGPPEPEAVHSAWQRLAQFDALMFVSANAVEQFFLCKPANAPSVSSASASTPNAVPHGPRFFVTGPGSLAALLQLDVPRQRIDAPAATAAQFDSEALWQVVGAQVRPGWRVLIVRGHTGGHASDSGDTGDEGDAQQGAAQGVGRDWLAARLAEQGAQVEFVVAYARRAPRAHGQVQALLQAAAEDGSVWLFSSSEAVANACAMAPGQSWRQARAVATHPRIAEAARLAGFGVVCESRPAMADLLASIESLA